MLLRIQPDEGAGIDHLGTQSIVLLARAVAPIDPVRLTKLGQLGHPIQEMTVLSTGLPVVPGGHAGSSSLKGAPNAC
jgi:hypothetical protein